MPLFKFIPAPTWRDLIDILFLTLVIYQLYVWFKETRALRVIIGLVVLGGIYSVAKSWHLFLTTWVFQILWQVLVILLLTSSCQFITQEAPTPTPAAAPEPGDETYPSKELTIEAWEIGDNWTPF